MTRSDAIQEVIGLSKLHEGFAEVLRDDLRRAMEQEEPNSPAYRVFQFALMRTRDAVERLAALDRKIASATEERAEVVRDLAPSLLDRRFK